MKQAKQIAINTVSSWIALFVSATVMIFLTKFLLHRLGIEQFGMFRYVITIQGSLMFLDLGLGATLNRFTSQLLTTKDYEHLNSVASFGCSMFLALGILAGATMVGLGHILPMLVTDATNELYSSGYLLMCCTGGTLAVRFWGYSARGLLYGSQRYDLVNAVQTGGAILRAVVVTSLFLMFPSSGLVTIGLSFLACDAIETTSVWVLTKRQIPSLRLSISTINKAVVKEVIQFSVFVLIMAVTTILIWNVPMFLTGRFYGPQALAFLSLPLLLLEQIQRIAGGFGFSLIPVAGKYEALGKAEMLRVLTIKGTKYCAVLCFPVGILAVIFGHPIFEWFKEGFGWTWALLGILMLPYLIRTTQRPSFSVLMGAKSIRALAIGQIPIVATIAVLGWLFAKYFEMGLYGVVLGAAIPILLFNFFFQPMYACYQVRLKWLSYMVEAYGRVVLGTVPAAVIGVALVWYAYPNSLIMIIFEWLMCMLIFAACAWWFVLSPEERLQIRGLLKRTPSQPNAQASSFLEKSEMVGEK
jgi:O-antigen/teichoic acid export membrane protein